MRKKNGKRRKQTLGSLSRKKLSSLRPAPENDLIYERIKANDPQMKELVKSIRKHGVLQPIVISLDNFIVSGHRRHKAALMAGQTTVRCRVERVSRTKNKSRFCELLTEHNRYRDKSVAEVWAEEVVTSSNPEQAYQTLIEERQEIVRPKSKGFDIIGEKKRSGVGNLRQSFLHSTSLIIFGLKEYWPISVRRVHYVLLNNPPLTNSNQRDSKYRNDKSSYNKLKKLLTDARLEGSIPWEAIGDETRPRLAWTVYKDTRSFITNERESFFKGYWRDLMQSQPNYIEIILEKNTAVPILKNVAMKYCIPLLSCRGHCSLTAKRELVERYKQSGKDQLIVLILSDMDPDGIEIGQSFARSIRDDFGIQKIHPVRVAISQDQVNRFELPKGEKAKTSSTNYHKYVTKYGQYVYELEALEPEDLQQILRDAIDANIDTRFFNQELDREKSDAASLMDIRKTVISKLKGLEDLGQINGDS